MYLGLWVGIRLGLWVGIRLLTQLLRSAPALFSAQLSSDLADKIDRTGPRPR